ncbi:MAG TPA: hypothetical protein DCP69_02890 [Candidatus Omnitrophica bacterium]|nr:hypothetical protein [Candidatus Omnitrophota bacterium]
MSPSYTWGVHFGELSLAPGLVRDARADGATFGVLLNLYSAVRSELYQAAAAVGLPLVARDYRPSWKDKPTADELRAEVLEMARYGTPRLVVGNEINIGPELFGEEHAVTDADVHRFVREAWPLWQRIHEYGGIPLLTPLAQGGNFHHSDAYWEMLREIVALNHSMPTWLGAAYHCYANAEAGGRVIAYYRECNRIVGWTPQEEWITEAGWNTGAGKATPETHRGALVAQAQAAADGKIPPVAFWTYGAQPGFALDDIRAWPQTMAALKEIKPQEVTPVPQDYHIEEQVPGHGDRENTPLDTIVIHSTRGGAGTPEQELQATINWFKSPASQVSAHLVIAANGDFWYCVPWGRAAWHAKTYNRRSIGIELVQATPTTPFTDEQYGRLNQALDYLTATFGILPKRGCPGIVGHEAIDPQKSDPGALFDWGRIGMAAPLPEVPVDWQAVAEKLRAENTVLRDKIAQIRKLAGGE